MGYFHKRKRTKSTKEILREMNGVVKMCLAKVKFSETEVIARANELTSQGTPMYYYKCPNCQRFHLTRTPNR